MIRVTTLPPTLLLLAALAGCETAEPDFGARLRSEGGEVTRLGERWAEGDRMIREGRELVEEGEDAISTGEKQVRTGRDMIRKGRTMKEDAEEAYRLRGASPPGS